MTEGIRGEWQKADRAWTPEWQCERKGEPKSEKRMTNGLLALPVIDSSEYFSSPFTISESGRVKQRAAFVQTAVQFPTLTADCFLAVHQVFFNFMSDLIRKLYLGLYWIWNAVNPEEVITRNSMPKPLIISRKFIE
jgi:hypothetical protein